MHHKLFYPAKSEVRVLRLPEVMHRVGLGRSAIYAMVHTGEFPAPVRLGARVVGWTSEAITQWIEARIRRSAESAGDQS